MNDKYWPHGFCGCRECPTEYACAIRNRCLIQTPVPELPREIVEALAAPNPGQTSLPFENP